MDWHQLIKHFENRSNNSENEDIKAWINASEQNQKLYFELKEIWEATGNAPDEINLDYTNAWEKIKFRTNIKHKEKSTGTKIFPLRQWLKIAAVLIIMLGTASVIKMIYFNKTEMITETNLDAAKKEIHLSDGTTVILNRNSRLIYPEQFGQASRELILEGEALFNVAKDSLHPFIVHAGGTITKVLGTSFNVNGKNTSKVIVSVIEGKVAFKPESAENNQVQLTKGERGIFEKDAKKLSKIKITDENFLSWQTGILAFNNQTLGEAVKVLSDYYSKTIEVQPELQDRMITVTFNNQTLGEVLEILEITLRIKIDSKPERILLRAPKNDEK